MKKSVIRLTTAVLLLCIALSGCNSALPASNKLAADNAKEQAAGEVMNKDEGEKTTESSASQGKAAAPEPKAPQSNAEIKKNLKITKTITPAVPNIINKLEKKAMFKPEIKTEKQRMKEFYQSIIDEECAWIASLQLSNGAIPMTYKTTGEVRMNPYFADLAAMGLLAGDSKYLQNVRGYIEWHFARLNTKKQDYNRVDGTIYDYVITLEERKIVEEAAALNSSGTPQYDSTDSYAATFLSVLNGYHKRSGETEYLQSKYSDILRVINALFSTMRCSLTFAKPDYRVKYLMDNAEVFKGLNDAVELFENAFSQEECAEKILKRLVCARDKMKQKIDCVFWNSAGHYESAVSEWGRPALSFSWSKFYPDATAQLTLITNGVLNPEEERAQQLYESFNANFAAGTEKHNWPELDVDDSFYWCMIAHAAALMKDEQRVYAFMQNYREIMKTHSYPLYNAEAGHTIRAAAAMLVILV